MPATLDDVAHDALILPPEQRLALARQLLESVDLEPEPGAEAAWEVEIARRIALFQNGESRLIPLEKSLPDCGSRRVNEFCPGVSSGGVCGGRMRHG